MRLKSLQLAAVALLVPVAFAGFAVAQQVADPSQTLNSLEQTTRNAVSDLSRLRIDKWKADGGTKKAAQSDSESIQRNMSSALPELIAGVRNAPQDLNANFKLYRNLSVLHEYFGRFAETTGAFGSREDFDLLSRDLQGLESAQRAMADRMNSLTASAQAELNQYRSQVRAAQAAAAAAPPKKIVIDDSVSEKKSSKKKKSAPKPDSSTSDSGSQPSGQATGSGTPSSPKG